MALFFRENSPLNGVDFYQPRLKLADRFPERGEHGWTMREVIEALAHAGALKRST
jgi:hypothetical protein